MDASYWADVFSQARSISRKWATEQARTEAVFAALLEFDGRLRLLGRRGIGDPAAPTLSAFAAGSGLEEIPVLLRARHMRGVENLLGSLHESAERFKAHQAAFSDLQASVWQRQYSAAADGTNASDLLAESAWGVVGAGRGSEAQRVGMPPAAQCIEWIQELDGMHSAELLLKLELLETIDLTGSMSPEALQGVAEIWALQPHLLTPALDRLSALVESLTLNLIS